MSTNLSATTPAAPGGNTNVTWQSDGHGNISGYVPTGGGASVELQTNGVDNASQIKLNLKNGTNITLANSGADVTINGPTALPPSGGAGGDLTGTYPNPTLKATGTAGTYTKVTTDAQGRVSSGAAITQTDLPVVAATGSPALQLPTGITPSAVESLTSFGASNTQQCIQFVMTETMTFAHVTVYIGTGVVSDLMGIAIYDAAGTTELAKADAFSVDTTHTGAQRVALAASVTLYAGVTYWIAWTCSASGTVTTLNYLISTNWQLAYCAAVVRVGTSGTATSGGKCNATIGTVSNVQIRLPVMIFD